MFQDRLTRFKEWLNINQENVIITAATFLVAIIAFNAGRMYGVASLQNGIELINDRGEETKSPTGASKPNTPSKLDLRVVASKSGSKYHFLWCSGAKSIKEENKIYFASEEEAKSRGYTLAGNCQK